MYIKNKCETLVNDIISGNPDFTIDTTSFTIEPSQNQEVNVTFSPDSSGYYSSTLIIKSNDPINPVISVSLSGYALSQMSISETGLEFDTLTVGFSLSRQLVISNLYTEDLTILSAISDNPDYTVDISDFILEPGQSQEINVMFSPDSSGFSYGTLIIMTNDTLGPLMYVNLIGYALSQYIISEEELEFDSVEVGSFVSSQLIITNISSVELTIDTILSDNPDYTTDISNFILGPGQSREISITFSPGNPGFSAGTLTIKTDNPIDSVKYVYLFGYGFVPPQISIIPDEFQADLQTGDSIQQILTIENKGGTNLNFKINILEVFDINNTSTKSQNTNVNIPGLSFSELLQNWGNGIENQSTIFKKSYTRSGESPNEYSWDLLYTDPDEENLIYDIRNVYGCILDSELLFKLESNNSWSSPVNHGVTAIYIDADQNIFTGLNPENVGKFGWDLGIDYIVTRDFQLFQNGLYVWENTTDKFIWLDSLSTNIISENSNEIIIGINRKHFLKSFNFSLLSGSLHEDYGDYVPDPGNGHITLYFPVSWLYLNITGGKIPPENQEIITVTFNASQLQPGPYKAQLHLFSNDPEKDILIIPVLFNVSHATGLDNDQIYYQNSCYLYPNYPNPFSYETTITYNLPKPVMVNLSVFNIYGKLISTMVKQRQLAGLYSIEWNASEFPSGIYFFRLEAGKLHFTRKCTIIR